MSIPIKIASDFICPWCYIGEKRLAAAIASLPGDIELMVEFTPYELNPGMPVEGRDRKAYRSAKFGSWERSQAMDAQTVEAGRADGATFEYERIERTPNTFMAHRLAWFAGRFGKQRDFVETALQAYFAKGRDIGSVAVLVDLAGDIGLDRGAVRRFLSSNEGAHEVRASEQSAYEGGQVKGVPHFDIGGIVISGAQSVDMLRQAILDAAARQAPSSAE